MAHGHNQFSSTSQADRWGGKMPGFAHEMLREIYEQPEALRRTMALYLPLRPAVA